MYICVLVQSAYMCASRLGCSKGTQKPDVLVSPGLSLYTSTREQQALQQVAGCSCVAEHGCVGRPAVFEPTGEPYLGCTPSSTSAIQHRWLIGSCNPRNTSDTAAGLCEPTGHHAPRKMVLHRPELVAVWHWLSPDEQMTSATPLTCSTWILACGLFGDFLQVVCVTVGDPLTTKFQQVALLVAE